ncbi:MAG: hypothetical protein U5K31_02410 [Balneolaceae bacterium]|nr:hypothetical protein [Balneolaceae bacterium]
MKDRIKSLLPGALVRPLQLLYYHLWAKHRRGPQLTGRDWSLDLAVPESKRRPVLEAVMKGEITQPSESGNLHVLHCAQPKSAGLHMVQLLSLTLDFKNHQIGFDRGGGDIYFPRLLAAGFTGRNTISHCHATAKATVLKLIRTLRLRPLIQTRNLLDALVSRRDMLVRDQRAPKILSDDGLERFLRGSGEYQLDVVSDLFAHNYINFYVGWNDLRGDADLRPIFISYEEIQQDEVALVRRVARELGVEVSERRVRDFSERIAEKGGINFSRGVSGRGRELFNERQIDELREKARMLGCYDEDFLGFSVE